MSAVGDSPIRILSVPEPSLSHFSRYHAFVSKSLWDPLADGFVGAAIDLIGRVIIIMTAVLGGYLVAALFSIRAWCSSKNQDDIYTVPHTHHQAISLPPKEISEICDTQNQDDIYTVPHTHHQAISLPPKEILQICDTQNLQEEDCFYDGELTFEKNQIQSLMQDSKTKLLVDYIFKKVGNEKGALAALFVVLGIKPAFAFERSPKEELIVLLKNLADGHPSLRWKVADGFGKAYFVNEHPFPSFDPRKFLLLSPQVSLVEAVEFCFSEQGQVETDQWLSYLLGFGPSWETYATRSSYLYEETDPVCCLQKEEHYYELGNVLNHHLKKGLESRSQIAQLGFAYHSEIALLIKKGQWGGRERIKLFFEHPVFVINSKTQTDSIFDGISARTDYCKKSYTLKKWVMETYFSELKD